MQYEKQGRKRSDLHLKNNSICLRYGNSFGFISSCKESDDPIPPTVKSMTQSVALKDKAKIEYSATLSNVSKARLNVKKDGVSISTEEISDVSSIGADYQKSYSYTFDPKITKGNYEFTLESENASDNLEKKTNYVNIPNYPASVTYSTSLDLNQNSEIKVPYSISRRQS